MSGRAPYQGVLQIVRFNRTFYTGAAGWIAIAMVLAASAGPPWRAPLLAAMVPAAYWTCASLAVSHYVYDRHPLYEPAWLAGGLAVAPQRWLYLHAGLDEFSQALRQAFPDAAACVLDIYDPARMTEPSIREARRLSPVPHPRADWRSLPLRDEAFDAVFLLFAAHELRCPAARDRLFAEVARTVRRGGEVVVLEHLRDWPNFAAFGPGFLHFFAERTWLRAGADAGLAVRRSTRVTPFVRLFLFARPL